MSGTNVPQNTGPEKSRVEKIVHNINPTLNSNSLVLPKLFDSQPVRDAFFEWFGYLRARGKASIDPSLIAAKACQLFSGPDELRRSINYAMANQYVTLKDYSRETETGSNSGDKHAAAMREFLEAKDDQG
jgi:hypothetical protein